MPFLALFIPSSFQLHSFSFFPFFFSFVTDVVVVIAVFFSFFSLFYFNQQRNVILLTLYTTACNSMLLSDVIVSFHQLCKMPLLCMLTSFFFSVEFIKTLFHSIPSNFGERMERKKTSTNAVQMYWHWIDADFRDFQFRNLHFKWKIGKPSKHTLIHSHTRSEHTLCDWSVMECRSVRVEMWWNYCSIEWFMPFFMCILCNVSYFFIICLT